MVNLRCPVCAGALEKRAGAYLCPKNHSFDIAKSGYVNLLLNSSQGHHGDDKLMVRARRDFLDKGYYDRFIAAVADAAAEFTPPEATVLDAGCGEGIYSLAVLRAIEKAGKHGELLGVDISKTALQYASKRSPDFTLCVASCAHLPVEDGSVDEVLNIFSPFVPEEFARVLKPGGTFCGCFYVSGECRRTDRLIKKLYEPMKFFTPPYETVQSLKVRLEGMYADVQLGNVKSIAWFVCKKVKYAEKMEEGHHE